MIDAALRAMDRMGRAGAAVSFAMAVAAGWGGWQLLVYWRAYGKVLLAGVALSTAALFLGLNAVRLLVRGGPSAPTGLSVGDFLAQAMVCKRPFIACLDCRLFTPVPPCPRCGSSSSCMEVRDGADLELLRASLPDG
jgi:hypothetical protein